MRKILLGLFFLSLIKTTNVLADTYQPYVEGQVVENNLSLGKGKYNIPLPPGKFTVAIVHRRTTTGAPTRMYSLLLLKLIENNIVDEAVTVTISKPTSTYWLPIKNCKRSNVYFIDSYIKGKAQSCWYINHHTYNFSSNKIKKKSFTGKMRDYVIENKIINPNVGVYSQHYYASPRHKNVYFSVAYHQNPELRGVNKDKARNWKESEYLHTQVHNYPKKKAYLDSFVIKSAKYQKDFENGINMHQDHRLDTSMALQNNKQIKKKNNKPSSLGSELAALNKLYKSGVLTKSEFEKAKKKLLDK